MYFIFFFNLNIICSIGISNGILDLSDKLVISKIIYVILGLCVLKKFIDKLYIFFKYFLLPLGNHHIAFDRLRSNDVFDLV